MKILFLTFLFCAFYLNSYAQTSFVYADIQSKNLISELNQQSLCKQNKVEINYSFLQKKRIAPKKAKIFGRILQGTGIFLASSSLTMAFLYSRFVTLGKQDYYAFAGIFVAGGVIFYTGTRIVINSKKKIRENLLGIKNTSLFLKNESKNLFSSISAPTIGVSLHF